MGTRVADRRESDPYRRAVTALSEAVDRYDQVARDAGATDGHVLAALATEVSEARTSFVLLVVPQGLDDHVLIEEAACALERMCEVRLLWNRYHQEVSRDYGRR